MNDRIMKKALSTFIVGVLNVSHAYVDVGDTKRDGTLRIKVRSSETMCAVDMVTSIVDVLRQRGVVLCNVTDNSVNVVISSVQLNDEVNDGSEGDVSNQAGKDRTYRCRGKSRIE